MSHEKQRGLEPKALLVALVVAATVCAVAMFLAAVVVYGTGHVGELLPWVVLYFLGAFVVGGVVGLFALGLLLRIGLARWWTAMVVGALSGAAFSLSLHQEFEHLVAMAAIGAASGGAFWTTWRKLGGVPRAT